jgi:hypothetical protein
MPAPKKNKKKTAFVPRSLFANAVIVVGVVPFCVTSCGGKSDQKPAECDAFCAADEASGEAAGFSVTDAGFSVANVGFDVADGGFSVAAVGFDAGHQVEWSVADGGFVVDVEAGQPNDAPTDASRGDAQLTVANIGFDAATHKPRDAGDAG